MPMTFEEAEAKFRQLQARVQRGEAISRAEYEDQVSMLSVTDDNGVLWEINPRNGKWMYFDGAEWVSGSPPGHDTSSVIPAIGTAGAPPLTSTPPPAQPSMTRPVNAAPMSAPRANANPKPPTGPESTQPVKRPGGSKPIGTPPGAPAPTRPAGGNRFAGREWVPLAIGAVVLVFCAVALFAGYAVLNQLSPKATPTMRAAQATVFTGSPTPTIVRLPSPTPLPPTPVPVIAQVSGDYANVRSKASTSGTIVVKLQKAAQVTLIAVGPKEGANVWYQINVPDKPEPGWVRSDTIKILSGDPATLPPAGGAPTATKPAAVPAATKAPAVTPTPTVIGVIPPTPKAYP